MNYKVHGQHPEVWLENRNTPLEHQATHLLFLRSGLGLVKTSHKFFYSGSYFQLIALHFVREILCSCGLSF